MNFYGLSQLVLAGLDRDDQKQQVAKLDGEDVIFAHNRLKELDDLLRERWFEVGSPHPELLK